MWSQSLTEKLIRRHPHVFGDARGLTPKAVEGLWERIKREERAQSGEKPAGALAGVPVALPALTRALKLQTKAGKVGFDWNDPRAVLAKIREEAAEIEAELATGDHAAAAGEVGDLLFAVVNLARHFDVDPEATLRATNQKFERRFAAIEIGTCRSGQDPATGDARGNGRALGQGQGRRTSAARGSVTLILTRGPVRKSTLSSRLVLVITSRRSTAQPFHLNDAL